VISPLHPLQVVELSGNDDDGSYPITIPFTWWYLGGAYSTVYVGTNGSVVRGSCSRI
jgi:hypothetical protein